MQTNPLPEPSPSGHQNIIESTRDLPDAYLLSRVNGEFPLTEEWRGMFAVLRAGNTHFLVVSTTAYGSHQMFEVRRAMKEANLGGIQVLKAKEEVIKLIYSELEVATGMAAESKMTNVEEEAASIVNAAIHARASDIHIEARGPRANVFFRINGTRKLHTEITSTMAHSIGVVLYTVHADANSKETSWDPTKVMEAAVEWTTPSNEKWQLRFASSPIFPSESFQIVIRLLSMEAKGRDLPSLGYTQKQLAALEIMISGSSGIVIVCGPVNSGKSTSQQALMGRIYARRGDTIKMITVEDPVEYVIPGACQISVPRGRKNLMDEKTKSVFSTFLRGTLRQDPDVVMVGEIRDHESAIVVKDLALAGRKLMATLHTYSALWVFIRLREIGIPMEVLTMPGFIAGIVFQRLVPVLCPDCSMPLAQGEDRISAETLYRVKQVADLSRDTIKVKGDGCPKCQHTGVVDQTVCAEFVLPDRMLLGHLANNDLLKAETYWRGSGVGAVDGGVTALAHGIAKMKAGLVDPSDVEERIGLLTSDMVSADNMLASTELSLLMPNVTPRGDLG